MGGRYKESRPILSALYHRVPGSIFSDGNKTYRIDLKILTEELSTKDTKGHLIIRNQERLGYRLRSMVISLYQERLLNHNLNLPPISNVTPIEIKRFRAIHDMGDSAITGYYSLYPLEFICSKCHKLITMSSYSDLENNEPLCSSCGGNLEQNTIVTFCETCGLIKPLNFSCGIHNRENIILLRGKKDSIRTWKVVCKTCMNKGSKFPVDIMRLECKHNDYGRIISDGSPKKYKILTVRDGGVTTPVNIKTIDVEKINIDVDDQDYIVFGIERGDLSNEKLSQYIDSSYLYEDPFVSIKEIMGMSNTKTKKLYADVIDYIYSTISKLKEEYVGKDVETITDLWYLKHNTNSISYCDYLDKLKSDKAAEFSKSFSEIQSNYKIANITYMPDIRLISSTIGIIKGPTKYYDDSYAPHFEPFWEDRDKKSIFVISQPFETEGVLFEIDESSITKWLFDNKIIDHELNVPDSKNFIASMEVKSKEYGSVMTLLHTLSHKMIKKSSAYTGLDEDTYGEIIFPANASFMIYSTSTVNIGGLGHIFKYFLPNWFYGIEDEMSECTFDPSCNNEKGACFNCLYLPEYVCCNFNKDLSRHCFIGGGEYELGFWTKQ